MKKILPKFLLLSMINLLFGHCQVPCGIYDDQNRILSIYEDIRTIEKSINILNDFFYESTSYDDPQSMNQMVRWISTKEDHAQNIQNIMLNYFLAQRIKPKEPSDDGYEKYIVSTSACHKIIFFAMKCKQNTDQSYLKDLEVQLFKFIDIYFDEHGKNHINELLGK